MFLPSLGLLHFPRALISRYTVGGQIRFQIERSTGSSVATAFLKLVYSLGFRLRFRFRV